MSAEDRIKTVYLVRHGRTKANGKLIFQKPDEPLSNKGREQAKKAAEWFKDKEISTVSSSTYPRAIETATIIGERIGLQATLVDSVSELHRPRSLYGLSYFSPKVLSYVWQLYRYRKDSAWQYEGAENFPMIRRRIEIAKQDIANLPGKNIIVVSHRFFIALFIIAACTKGPLKISDIFRQFLIFLKVKNTSVFKFKVDTGEGSSVCKWIYCGTQTSNN